MRLKGIIDRFTLVSGLEMKEVSRFLPVIEDCRLFFEERLYEDLSEEALLRAENACAVYAYYKISMMGGCGSLSSFKVGDVQMQTQPPGVDAERLWTEERERVSDIMDMGDSLFRRVRV